MAAALLALVLAGVMAVPPLAEDRTAERAPEPPALAPEPLPDLPALTPEQVGS